MQYPTLPFAGPGSKPFRKLEPALAALPGLALCVLLGAVAQVLIGAAGVSAVSPMVGAILLGMVLGNTLRVGELFRPGLAVAVRPVLRIGIVLIAFQITLGDIAALGGAAVVLTVATMGATFVAILAVGALLGVPKPLTEVIAAGTSVCGASAIMAAAPAARAGDADTAYALATVTFFGTLSLLLFPFVGAALGLDPVAFGLWAGATIHEVGQVTAVAFQAGETAGYYGTISKLLRVSLLVVVILALVVRRRMEAGGRGDSNAAGAVSFPFYVLAFGVFVVVNSVVSIPAAALDLVRQVSLSLMTVALAAMGLTMNVRALTGRGLRPLALGFFGWTFVSGTGLALILVLGI